MADIRASRSSRIGAAAQTVYAILADYRQGHPSILPRAFTNLHVERGGYGDGTAIRFDVHLLGAHRTVHAEITEPEPGRVLAEQDTETGARTTFTVTPLSETSCEVTIVTEWTAPGVRGLLARLLGPPVLERIYRQELDNLRRVASQAR